MTGKCTIDGDQKQSLDIALGQQQPVERILRAGFRIGRNCNVGYFYLKKSHADCFETTGHVFQGHFWIELAQTRLARYHSFIRHSSGTFYLACSFRSGGTR